MRPASSAPPAAAPLSDRWEVVNTPEGNRALVPNSKRRRAQARTGVLMTMGMALVTFLIVSRYRGPMGPAVLPMIATCAFAGRALWLAGGRMEWHIGERRLTLRRRFGLDVRVVFEARRLRLDGSPGGDGFVYALRALADCEPPASLSESAWHVILRKDSRTVMQLMNPDPVRDLAAWLVRETDMPLEDRIPPMA